MLDDAPNKFVSIRLLTESVKSFKLSVILPLYLAASTFCNKIMALPSFALSLFRKRRSIINAKVEPIFFRVTSIDLGTSQYNHVLAGLLF